MKFDKLFTYDLFSELSWGRSNRNRNPPGNLSSQKTVEQLGREVNKMWSIGWS